MRANQQIKVHILHCGSARVDEALAYREGGLNPFAFAGLFRSSKHRISLPLTCYLIEHPKGLILVDTGWHPLVRTSPVKALGIMQRMLSRVQLPEGKAAIEQLNRLGYKPSDINYLILTHLHADHVSGLKTLSGAQRILVSDIELKTARRNPIVYAAAMWSGVNLENFSFEPSAFGPENLAFDLFKDGSVQLISTPGHTAGLTSLIIKSGDQFILLCADVAYSERSWNELVLPGLTTSNKKAKRSLMWIAQLSKDPACRGIYASHDGSIAEQVITL
ncbi:MAG: N-acyl homoserine lactonase family protein [Sphingobacteriales bacterium]|nr:MAG: N-acyl homoserine lactonase family protein [Sphingobacteriales bacterium]